MKMVNIMNYKIIIYAIMILLSTFIVSGLNINGILKKNKKVEANLFIISLIMIMSYLLTNFIIDFIEILSFK